MDVSLLKELNSFSKERPVSEPRAVATGVRTESGSDRIKTSH